MSAQADIPVGFATYIKENVMTDDLKVSATKAGLNGKGLRIGIVQSRFNPAIGSALVSGCIDELNRAAVASNDIVLFTCLLYTSPSPRDRG